MADTPKTRAEKFARHLAALTPPPYFWLGREADSDFPIAHEYARRTWLAPEAITA